MDVPTNNVLARVLRFSCLGTLFRSASPALAFTRSLFGGLNNDGIAVIIAFSVFVIVVIIYF
jgi:hypothetical protein